MNITFFFGKTESERPLGSHRCRLEDNIKSNFRELGYANVEWIRLAQDRVQRRTLMNVVMNLWVA